MALSSELIDQLIKVTQNTEPRDKDNTAYGTVVIMGSKKYVKIDGSDLMTPVSSTVAVENGDRVIVTIKSHSAIVTGNTSSPAASDKKVTELGTKISDFEIVIADKVSAKELDVQIGRIDDLTADNATIKESLTVNKAKIDDLTAKNAEITGTLEANKAKIDDLDAKKLDAEVADIKYASVDRLDATDANLRNLKSDYAQFEKTTTGELEATNAKIDGLDTKYANVDFSNIGKAAIEQFYATSGIIKDLVVGDQTITGELVGITITGDLIKGNTIVADKLVIKGSDGLYYKLNTDGVTTEKEQTEYNSLNGQIIQAKSITATKIDVKDLVAFGATIGGFNIGQDSIFSGLKETVDNKSRGIYMDKNGQIAIGDVNNYIKYFKDTDGRYRLKISAASLEFNASGDSGEESKDLETVIKDINDKVDGIAKTNKGIGSITNYYLATSESSGVTTKTAGWTTKIQNVSSSKKYLWNYEVTKYTDDTIANTTEPCIIGMYSAVGATGNGIQKITEYYALSALKDSVPTVWSENVPNLTATNKYMWNYEEILYTNGGTELTKKRIIGVYGDTGKDGAKGEDGYSPTATVSKNGDTTTITIVDKTGTHTQTVKDGINGTPGKDGINGKTTYFHVKYSNDGGKTFTSNSGETVGSYIGTCTNYTEADPTTVGSYVWAKIKGEKGDTGAKGVGVSSVDVMYYKSTSATSLSGGSWVTTDPGWENGKYIWSKTVITYTDKTTDESTPVCITGAKGSTGGTGAKGETGATGKGVSSIVEQYYQSTSATSLSGGSWSEKYPGWTNGKYIWTRSVITYTDKTTTTTTAVCVTGAKGSDGNNGKSIGSVINYYLATSASSGVSTSTSGWTTTVQNVTLEKKYLWNYEVVKYTDGTVASTTSPCIIGTYGDTGKTGATGKNALQVLKQWNGTYTTIGQEVNCPIDRFNRIPVTGDMFTNVDASSNLGTWQITKVADGQAYFKMVSYVSAKGATGATGNGIKSIKEHYAVSTSNTVTPTSWLDDVPVTNPVNKYLWNYETITYTNGTSVDSKKRVIGVYGDTGKDGKGIKSTAVTYQASTSGTVIPTGTWQTSIPTVSAGQYLWTRTVITYTDDSKSISYSVGRMGTNGTNGTNGSAGRGIKSTAITYQAGSSGTTAPTGTWQTTVPATSASSPYLWTRTIITYTDDTTSTSYAVGSTLEGVSVGGRNLARKTSNEYCAAFNSFNGGDNICPNLATVSTTGLTVGDKVTVRLVYKYTNIVAVTGKTAAAWLQGAGNITEWKSGTFVSNQRIALSGSGEKVIKYSFAITSDMIKNQCWYVKIRHDGVKSGSVQWKEFKVEKGNIATDWTPAPEDGIASVDVEYYLSTSATALSGGSWSTTAPTWVNGKYMWSRTVTTDGAGNKAYSPNQNGVCIAGAKGETGNDGKNALQPKRNWNGTFTTIGETVNVSTSSFNRTPVVGDVFTNLDGSSNTGTWEITKIENGNAFFKLLSYVSSKGATGATGATGKGVTSIVEQYYKSTSATALSGGSWGTTYPGWESGKYIWTRSVITYTDKTTTTTTAVCVTGTKGAPGKDANQVVHSVAGNGNTNQYIEFATVKVIRNYANYATTFKISGREYETTDVQFSFVSVNSTDPRLNFLRATGGFNVWMYKKTTSTWGLVTKLNEAWGSMRVYNFRPDNESISLTWTDTRHASLPSGCIAADQLQAAKTATNFMEFNSGTGLQIGDKTNGSWKGFRSRITSTAFEILNEAGAAVASYGRKLIQLGKDTTDAVIELCGGKGIIKYENVWLYGGEDDTLTISAENMAILADKNIVIRAKRVTADNIRITNQLFMSDTNIHLTMYEMNADLPDEADDCIAGIDIDKKYGINLETLGVTDRALTGVSINGRSLLNHIYPVGSIYMSTSATNPTNFFGGTWVAWGAGRVPVGFNGGDGNFNSSEKTGGSKTINIEHNHGLSNARAAVGRADSSLATMSYTSGGNPHNVYFDREFSYYGGISGGSKHATDTSLIYGSTNNGGSTAASVLQPYITCYMWKRTA